MMIEEANLASGVKRATQIAKGNLLLIGVSTVGVKWITNAIGFLLGAIGLVLGLGVGYGLVSLFGTGTAGLVVGIGLGAMIFFVFVMVASVISSYTMTAYNTCLFLWARDVEKAQTQSQAQGTPIPVQIPAPAPLAAVLREVGLAPMASRVP
jgi:ABC-type transport system involved in multi-copper enzyme maturation permease subunit